jgi:hypothetical protein
MTQDLFATIDSLDRETAGLILEKLILQLRNALDNDARNAVQDEGDAKELIHVVEKSLDVDVEPALHAGGEEVIQLLRFAAEEPVVRETLREILAHPPSDRQMAVDAVITDPFILGALATLLQTRFKIHVKSSGGRKSYEVEVGKEASNTAGIVSLLKRLWNPDA